ncbi:glycosyltransferase [uncultured Salinisphaera sp.]|uniref:glycosyltransferase n=1 Tax=uncultured Salinisphaera sp. TaxID=359372 RepID=UPI0032B278C4|tara:strand:+ start:799 stop:2016 length:1218 start_codon:yes stop_codon:yes gene_type:complete
MSDALRVAHYVSLSGFGGVEQHFAAFARRVAQRSDVIQTVVACSKTVHGHHADVRDICKEIAFEKKWRGIEIPRRPAMLRRLWAERTIARQAPDVALLWNRLDQQARAIDCLGAARSLYWEHGSAWLHGGDAEKQRALAAMPAVIANSLAAKRMLQLRWGYNRPIRVIPNGVRAPLAKRPRELTPGAPLRLGIAGRQIPIKGGLLAIHALAELREQGRDAVLTVAGDGPLRDSLEALANRLGIASHVRFAGVVKDMPGFFDEIDVFVHPALREPFGLVAAEAQSAGVPVVCTAVDGLPEVVASGQTGICVKPTADLERHAALGGQNIGLPPKVYIPDDDAITAPRVCEPADLAAAIDEVTADASAYTRTSANAIERVAGRFDFDDHVDRVLVAVREYAESATLRA